MNSARDRPPSAIRSWVPPTVEELQGVLGGYKVLAILGRGGMGAVYKARQRSLGRMVAIKVLPPPLPDADDVVHAARRFEHEARTMAQMNHPGIVAIHDFGQTEDEQFFFFVMEFVDGSDLAQAICGSTRLSPELAAEIVADVCAALDYAHRRGVIHRDIKPANILIGSDGQVKVADFGLARFVDPAQAQRLALTQSNLALGTPDYAAPELLTPPGTPDPRADLYSIGVMLYQMLTGEVPRGLFKMPSQKLPDLDARFDAIICKAMEPDREERYQSAIEITQDLTQIRVSDPPQALVPPPATHARASRWLIPAAIFAAAGWLFFRPHEPTASPPAAIPGPAPIDVNAGVVDVNALPANRGNIASHATLGVCDDAFGTAFGAEHATDGFVSGAIPGQPQFNDTLHAIFDRFGNIDQGPFSSSTNELILEFKPPVDLVELAAYVSCDRGDGPEDADRVATKVGFWVDSGGGLEPAGSVVPEDTDDIGGFDRVALAGSWSRVRQVAFTFTPINTIQYARTDVRVAEVVTIAADPAAQPDVTSAPENQLPPRPGSPPGDGWRDLLAGVDVQQHSLMDRWRLLEDGQLRTPPDNASHQMIELPVAAPPDCYDLRIELTRHQGIAALMVAIRRGEAAGFFLIDSMTGEPEPFMAQLGIVGGDLDLSLIHRPELFLPVHTRHTLLLEVRDESVTAKLDGETLITWPADWSDIRQTDAYFFPASLGGRAIFGVGACASEVTFHRVDLRAVE